jgi:hypothetical protein
MIYEAVDSRSIDTQRAELIYHITDSMDESEVFTALVVTAPTEFFGFSREKLSIEPGDWNVWKGTVNYVHPDLKKPEPAATGDSQESFDTSGGSFHITQSLETKSSTPRSPYVAPDFKGAIQVDSDGKVQGTDVIIPALKEQVTVYQPAAVVTSGYKKTVARLTGKFNSSSFKGYAAGELLFMGAQGSRRGNGDWEVRYDFEAKENVTSLDLGDITIPSAYGHDFVWLYYRDEEESASKFLIPRPVAAYVERVYEPGDFSLLLIGS